MSDRYEPTVTSVTARSYTIPTDQPEADGTLAWDSTTVVVAEVTGGGVAGLGWSYTSGAGCSVIEAELRRAVCGRSVLDVPASHEAMVRACRNLGRPGVVSSAISAVDIALWDCKARLVGVALADLIGRATEGVALYGSGGFTTYDDASARAQLERWTGEWAIPRVKIKIGESWGRCVEKISNVSPSPAGHRRPGRVVHRRQRGLLPQAGRARRTPTGRRLIGHLVRRTGLVRRPRRPAGGQGPAVPGRRRRRIRL